MSNPDKTNLEIITEKIITGMRLANRRLVERTAAAGGNLIVGDENGNPISVPAKELLKQLEK